MLREAYCPALRGETYPVRRFDPDVIPGRSITNNEAYSVKPDSRTRKLFAMKKEISLTSLETLEWVFELDNDHDAYLVETEKDQPELFDNSLKAADDLMHPIRPRSQQMNLWTDDELNRRHLLKHLQSKRQRHSARK
jgi:hypothetical protein